MIKKERLYPGLLLALAVLVVILTYIPGSLYGSANDWFAQHVSIAETMRQTILTEGTLFPGQLPLGGGSNIYDFAYYGYLRPDVLFACLLPSVPMETIIVAYSIGGYICSVLLFYLLLRKMKTSNEMALFGGVLFLCAGCFFQIHRQIMFINYMPYLLGALLGVLRYHKTGKKAALILMMVLIELHSYYYAISCLLVIYLFWLYTAEWEKRWLGRFWALTWRYALVVLTSVAMAGVLLLPSAASILSCAGSKDGGAASSDPWKINLDLEALLYSGYGLGLTLIVLLLLILALCRKKSRILAGFLLFTLVCGLVPLILNGFLYNRAKILIPFTPLVLLLAIETLMDFWQERKRPPILTLLPVFIVTYLQYRSNQIMWVWVDLAFTVVIFAILYLRGSREPVYEKGGETEQVYKEEGEREQLCRDESRKSGNLYLQKKQKWMSGIFSLAVVLMCSYIFAYAIQLHRSDELIEKGDTVTSNFSADELQEFYEDDSYRFDTLFHPYQDSNRLVAYGAGRTSMYTSTANVLYSSFFYDEIKNPIGNNNRVGLYNRANPFFQYLMGVRYLEANENVLPVGYEIRQQKGYAVLAEREDVLPLCYGTTELLSEAAYRKLQFPDNLEALTAKSIVAEDSLKQETSGQAQDSFQTHFEELFLMEGQDYELKQVSAKEYKIIPKEPIKDKILAVTFRVEPTSRSAVIITINGITNKLSSASSAYPNGNKDFTYILSSPKQVEEFTVKTSGSYEISDVHVYSMDAAYLGKRTVYPLVKTTEAQSESAADQEEKNMTADSVEALSGKPVGKIVADGTITMPEDGYFITSYPYQSGYRAYVDGQPQEIETVNTAFVGFSLEAGTHEILLTYEPPLQKAGIVLSAAGWLIWLGMLLLQARKCRKSEHAVSQKVP